jgi:peptidoglycan/LPS O-acetylase OafA/YrhL
VEEVMVYALEGLRGIAALVVALFHGWPSVLTVPFRHGWLFVDLFFVISGFVMAHVYRDLSTLHEARSFALKRIGRLYPLHLVTLLAFIAAEFALQLVKLAGLGTSPPTFDLLRPWSLLSNVFLLHGVGLPGERAYNGPSWSISTEMWAYAMFAVTCLTLGRMRLVAWAALSAAGLLLWITAPDANHISDGTYFFRCMYGFFLGAMLPSIRVRGFAALQVLSAALVALVFVALDHRPEAKFAAPLVFALLVLALSADRGPVAGVLRAKPLQWLGRLSYSVYMVHWPLLVFFNPIGQALPEPYRSVLKVVYVAALLGVSVLTFHWVERPWRERFRSWASIRNERPRPLSTGEPSSA